MPTTSTSEGCRYMRSAAVRSDLDQLVFRAVVAGHGGLLGPIPWNIGTDENENTTEYFEYFGQRACACSYYAPYVFARDIR